MRLLPVVVALFASASIRAEVLTAFDTPRGDVPPLPKDATVWVKCFMCDALKEKIIQGLVANGYKVAPITSEASVRVIVAASVSVPIDGKAPRLDADDVYGKGTPPIPPAVKTGIEDASIHGHPRGILHLDAGAVHEGIKLTGSQGGGILVALGVSALTRWIHQSRADAARTPGVVELSVLIVGSGEKQGFGVVTAANTPETPDVLLDGAIAAAIKGLINGVHGVREIRAGKEGGNAH